MLEPLSCLAIACAVMQTISFSRELTTTVKRIRKDGSGDPDLAERGTNLTIVSKTLSQYLQDPNLENIPKNQAELEAIAKKCVDTASEILKALEKISKCRGGSFGGAIKLQWKKHEMEGLEKKMQAYQETMQSHILIHLWYVWTFPRTVEFLVCC